MVYALKNLEPRQTEKKEELHLVAVMNRPRVDAAQQPFKTGVTNAQRQRLSQRGSTFSARRQV
jgi:hypothetical protein